MSTQIPQLPSCSSIKGRCKGTAVGNHKHRHLTLPRPFFFFFFLELDLRPAFAFALSIRPCFGRRRAMPSSGFFVSFFFLRFFFLFLLYEADRLFSSFEFAGYRLLSSLSVDVRRWSGLEAPFFPLVLVITCRYDHRSTG